MNRGVGRAKLCVLAVILMVSASCLLHEGIIQADASRLSTFTGYVRLCPPEDELPGIRGVVVRLWRRRIIGDAWAYVTETKTDNQGFYSLTDSGASTVIGPSDYRIEEIDLPGYTSCTPNIIEYDGVVPGQIISNVNFYDKPLSNLPTSTATVTPTNTRQPTRTKTPTRKLTATRTRTPTKTATRTGTLGPTETETATPTPSSTATRIAAFHLPLICKEHPQFWTSSGLDTLHIKSLAVDPGNPQILYAGTNEGLYRKLYCQGDWYKTELPDVGVYAIAAATLPNGHLFAGTYGQGIYRSTDGGLSWESINQGLGSLYIYALALSPQYDSDHTVYAGTAAQGVFKSVDGGDTWQSASDGLTTLELTALSVHPADPQVLLAGTFDRGIFRSANGGESWYPVPIGNDVVWCLAHSRSRPEVVYAGTNDGVYRSDNGGLSWNPTDLGSTYSLVVHPSYPGYCMAGTYGSGVSVTKVGGLWWNDLSQGLGNRVVQALALDSASCGLLYAGTDDGVWQWSVD